MKPTCHVPFLAVLAAAMACTEPAAFDGTVDIFSVVSELVGDRFEVQVYQPRDIEGPLPVVVVLDGSVHSEPVALMAQQAGVQVLVVGVGYDDGFSPVRRRRDYTPTVDRSWEASGGLPEFRAFLLQTALPRIEEEYEVTEQRTLFGHSLGGLAALEILWQQDPADPVFTRAVAASPALHWDAGVAFDHEAAYSAQHDELPVSLLLTLGQLDQVRIWSYGQAMMEQLEARSLSGLTLHTSVYADALHDQAWEPAYLEAMGVLLAWP